MRVSRRLCFNYSLFFFVLLFVSPSLPLEALEARSSQFGYVLDLPVGWKEVDAPRAPVEWADGANEVAEVDGIAEVRAFARNDLEGVLFVAPADRLSPDELLDAGAAQMSARGEALYFEYAGRDAFFAEIEIEGERSGYMVSIRFGDYGGVLFVTAPKDERRSAEQELLSVADSLGPLAPAPGPVAVFFEGDMEHSERVDLRFPGPSARAASADGQVSFSASASAAETGGVLVSREATLLSSYEFSEFSGLREEDNSDPEWLRAWRRYFRLIYRDSYNRLEGVAADIVSYIESHGIAEEDRADLVLSWLQSFEFRQSPNAGLFQPPVESMFSASGDCDSLALLYVILLDHIGVDAKMMVSVEYGHAVALVSEDDAARGMGEARGNPQGTRTDGSVESSSFEIAGERYLPAEMTAAWPLGSIARVQNSPQEWFVVSLQGGR